jgi:hypothetical protein
MAALTVGSGQQFSTISAAVAASRDGDVVSVQAGTYTNDFATINSKITLQGVGGMVEMVATEAPPDGKAILTTNTDATIDHFAFSGAAVPDGNGAGIRYQGGNLTVTNSHFHNNENGLLSNSDPSGSITIRNSEFDHNGAGDGYTHNLYVGEIGSLTIDGSYFHDASLGHEIKSRAHNTTVTNTHIADGDSTASYSIDLPNGGHAVLTGNHIEQGPNSQNPAIVHFGGEGNDYAGSSLVMTDNTIVNELDSPSARLLVNQTGATATITGTDVHGLNADQLAYGPANVSGTSYLDSAPAVDASSPSDGGSAPVPAPAPEPDPAPPAATPDTDTVGTAPGSETDGTNAGNPAPQDSQDASNGGSEPATGGTDSVQTGDPTAADALYQAGLSDLIAQGNEAHWGPEAQQALFAFLSDAWGHDAGSGQALRFDAASFDSTADGTAAVPPSSDYLFG